LSANSLLTPTSRNLLQLPSRLSSAVLPYDSEALALAFFSTFLSPLRAPPFFLTSLTGFRAFPQPSYPLFPSFSFPGLSMVGDKGIKSSKNSYCTVIHDYSFYNILIFQKYTGLVSPKPTPLAFPPPCSKIGFVFFSLSLPFFVITFRKIPSSHKLKLPYP